MSDTSITITSKKAFFAGVIVAILATGTVGFIVLAAGGKFLSSSAGSTLVKAVNDAPTPAAPLPQQPPARGAEGMAPITDKDWVQGSRSAKISVVEYSDTECPFCKRHHPTMQRVITEYDGKVNWVYRHFPLTQLHSKAPKEAEAAECAGELAGNDGFWKFLDRIFEVTPANNGLDPAELPNIAQYVGLNRAKFEACLNSGKYAQKVQQHAQDAAAAGGTGTPYNVIVTGDKRIPVSGAVPFEQFKAIIDPLL